MRSGTIAFLIGIVALQQFKELPESYYLLLVGVALLLHHFYPRPGSKLIIWLLMGFLWAWFNAFWVLGEHLTARLEGKDIQVEGHIASLPINKGRLWQFAFDLQQARYQGERVNLPKHIRLNWYGEPPALKVGDKWRLTVRLKQPHGFMNPGGFDYEKWLFARRIRATGYVRTREGYQLLDSRLSDYPVQRLRQYLYGRLQAWLPDHPLSGVITALSIGYREGISQQQWQVFRNTGTNHLVAISGLHIGLVAGMVFFLVNWVWARAGRLPLYLAAPRAAALMAFAAALIYATLAGWSLPTQRAMIMVAVVMSAVFMRRHVLPSHGLALALLLVLLHDPMAVLSPGFWLSFGAVAVIFLGMQGRRQGRHWWRKWLRIQWIVALGLLPLLIVFFQQASLVSPLANLVAVPLVSLLVVPLLLTGILLAAISSSAAQGLIGLSAWLLQYLLEFLSWLGQPAYATWAGALPHPGLLVIVLAGTGIFLFSPIRSNRWLGLVCLLPLAFPHAHRLQAGEAVFTLLDVGQGLAAVVQTRRHGLVFDTGPRFSHKFDTGKAVVIPFLRQQGIRQVDTLIVSHGDNDHIGGVDSLLQQVPVGTILTSAPRLLSAGRGHACQQGQHWQWDGVTFQVLHPSKGGLGQKENNQSCVLMVKSPHGSILLPGDIEKEAEAHLVGEYANHLKSDILVAAHHGSKTSSSSAFIAAVDPRYVLFPVGYRNRYRFPYYKVVKRFRQSGAAVYDTAKAGAIQIRLTGKNPLLIPQLSRQHLQRYWHHKRQ